MTAILGSSETVRYTHRIRPGAQAVAFLQAEGDRSRWIWNECVHIFDTYQGRTLKVLSKMLTKERSRHPWLLDGSSISQQQTLRDFTKAVHTFFTIKGVGKPKIKKKKEYKVSVQYVGFGFSFHLRDGILIIPKGISIPVVWSRPLPSKPTSVRIYQDSLGHWYASFVVNRETISMETNDEAIGIDWGVKNPVTTTKSEFDVPYRGYKKRVQSEIAKLQRKQSRRRGPKNQPKSKGYKQVTKQIARLHKKAARQNKDDAWKWANKVTQENQIIAVEDFKPQFLDKTRMSKKSRDNAIGIFKSILLYTGEKTGRNVILIDPKYTTMTCSECMTRAKHKLELSQRVFSCEYCGFAEDRDRNAARVVLNLAMRTLAGHNQASVDDISHELTDVDSVGGLMHSELERSL